MVKRIENLVKEEEFQNGVIHLARVLGWRVAHFRGVRIQRANGGIYYQTPVQADGKGFPDLVLVHEQKKRTVFAELKSESGKCSPEQYAWLEALKVTPCNEVYLWRPSDWESIKDVLMAGDALTRTAAKLKQACDGTR